MIFQLVNVCMWLFFLEYKKKLKYINILYISLYIYIYSYRDIEICIYILYMYICIIDVYVCELKYINILYISLYISTSTSISVEIQRCIYILYAYICIKDSYVCACVHRENPLCARMDLVAVEVYNVIVRSHRQRCYFAIT